MVVGLSWLGSVQPVVQLFFDASQVKDGDYVICTDTWEKSGGVFHATLISKRLSHSPH